MRTRRNVTLAVLVGALAPSGLALVGYLAAGTPHVDCGDTERSQAFYRIAVPFFALAALDAFLPGQLNHPAGGIVVVLGLAALVGAVVTMPVTIGLVAVTGTKLYRGRDRGAPDRKERRVYLLLVGSVFLTALPALIVGISLNADPLCFSF